MKTACTGCDALRMKVWSVIKDGIQPASPPARRVIFHIQKTSFGFTVIELAVVIALISVILSLGMPSFTSFIQFSYLQNDSWKIISDLRNYRHQAIVEHYDYRIAFDISRDKYTVEQRNYLTGALVKTVKTVSFTNDLTSAGDVTFHPRGNATVGGTITLRSRQAAGSATLTVQATTGAVQTQIN